MQSFTVCKGLRCAWRFDRLDCVDAMIGLHGEVVGFFSFLLLLLMLENIFSVVYFGSLENWNFAFVSFVLCLIGIDYLLYVSVPIVHILFCIPIFIVFEVKVTPSQMLHVNITNPKDSCRFLEDLYLANSFMRLDIACRPSLKASRDGQLFCDGFRFVI